MFSNMKNMGFFGLGLVGGLIMGVGAQSPTPTQTAESGQLLPAQVRFIPPPFFSFFKKISQTQEFFYDATRNRRFSVLVIFFLLTELQNSHQP